MVIESDVSRLEVSRLALQARQLVRLREAVGATIRCEHGSVWLTQDGEYRDVVLTAGERFRIDQPAPLLLQAFEPSQLAIASPAAGRVGPARFAAGPHACVTPA